MKKLLIGLILILSMVSCKKVVISNGEVIEVSSDVLYYLPQRAKITKSYDGRWVEFELDGNVYLFGNISAYKAALTKIGEVE